MKAVRLHRQCVPWRTLWPPSAVRVAAPRDLCKTNSILAAPGWSLINRTEVEALTRGATVLHLAHVGNHGLAQRQGTNTAPASGRYLLE